MQFPGADGQSTSQIDVIDTHCHLTDAAFTEDIEEVVKRAQASGITGAILVTESCGDFKRALELHSRFPKWINLCMGVHPVQEDEEGRCVKLEHWLQAQDLILANREKLVGIGEVGLDFTPRYCSRPDSHETQRAVLLEQARLAKQLGLPLKTTYERYFGTLPGHYVSCLAVFLGYAPLVSSASSHGRFSCIARSAFLVDGLVSLSADWKVGSKLAPRAVVALAVLMLSREHSY
ncbi:hypothetical protein AAHC03_01820 [Spirometra sp. Aus1]